MLFQRQENNSLKHNKVLKFQISTHKQLRTLHFALSHFNRTHDDVTTNPTPRHHHITYISYTINNVGIGRAILILSGSSSFSFSSVIIIVVVIVIVILVINIDNNHINATAIAHEDKNR
jgi:hypothetical protein